MTYDDYVNDYHYGKLSISPFMGQQETGNKDMKNKFALQLPGTFKYETYEAAEKEAKRLTAHNRQEYVIAQAIATTVDPVPSIEVVKL